VEQPANDCNSRVWRNQSSAEMVAESPLARWCPVLNSGDFAKPMPDGLLFDSRICSNSLRG
jgi:hypothetical protein